MTRRVRSSQHSANTGCYNDEELSSLLLTICLHFSNISLTYNMIVIEDRCM